MPESSKTLRQLLLGKIHRAVVTRADIDYVGSITIDEALVEAAGFLPNEKVDIYDVTNGSRLSTYVIPATRGSGEVGINGAAAHLVRPGDLVIIACYGWMKDKAARKHRPSIVHVDDENRPKDIAQEERNSPQDPFGHLSASAVGALDQDEQDLGLALDASEVAATDGSAPEPPASLPPPKKKKDRERKKRKKLKLKTG
jgi:aspartate 1-decarboxylase